MFVGRNVAFIHVEAVANRCTVKKVSIEILQNSQEITCDSLVFNKVADFIEKRDPGTSVFL